MAFLDDFGKKISQAGQGVAQSTKNFAAVSKFNGLITEEEKKIDNLFYQMGKLYFEMHRDAPEENLINYVNAVITSYSNIEACNEQIKRIRGISNCPNCGAEVPYTSMFCNSCGTKIPQNYSNPAVQMPVNSVQCGNCGFLVPAGYKFCTSCGSVIGSADNQAPAQPPIPAQMRSCPNCGKELDVDALFCTGCGQQI